jgi:hypothetical protein
MAILNESSSSTTETEELRGKLRVFHKRQYRRVNMAAVGMERNHTLVLFR